jgi:hypothetical protein
MLDRTLTIAVQNAPIILHTGFGGRGGLLGPAGPLPAGAAFESGSAMCGVECSGLSRSLKFPDGRGKRKSFGAG